MKKIIFILTILLSIVSINTVTAQTGRFAKTQGGAVLLDTLSNADTSTMYSPVMQPAYYHVALQYTATRLSGTAAGSAVLYAYIDGNWKATGDTLTFTNQVTNSVIWDKLMLRRAYKVETITSGTVSLQTKVSFLRQ